MGLSVQIYEQMPNEKGTTVYALQKKFQGVFGFTLPLFHGRGLLNCKRL
jgi:2-acylglycerol O-acyltransferase 2